MPIYSEINLFKENVDTWINNLISSIGENIKKSMYRNYNKLDNLKNAEFRFYDNGEMGYITRIPESDTKFVSFNIKDDPEKLFKSVTFNVYAFYQILKAIKKLGNKSFNISFSPAFTHRNPILIESTTVKFILMPINEK